jgi:site-specific DNA-cytosine methylase
MENVPQVCGENNLEPWNSWLTALEHLGYCNYPRIINSKDYGIPQNRRRCFMVSLLGDWSYTFPKKVKLRYRIKDFLDKDVGEEYYLSDKLIDCFIRYNKKHEERGNGFRFALKAGGDIAYNPIEGRASIGRPKVADRGDHIGKQPGPFFMGNIAEGGNPICVLGN